MNCLKNTINITLKKGLAVLILISVIPAYNMGNPIDYLKCLLFDECKNKEEI